MLGRLLDFICERAILERLLVAENTCHLRSADAEEEEVNRCKAVVWTVSGVRWVQCSCVGYTRHV